MTFRLEFKPQDLWVGAFWKTSSSSEGWRWHVDLWICLISCFPIHFKWEGSNI
jgi:hypothetical protein